MTGIWVDTDLGFDDLWALLLLRHLNCRIAGISLTAGNAPLPQVAANAAAALQAYGFDWPIWKGADTPLFRPLETAERILGPTGMRSRGLQLSGGNAADLPDGAIPALQEWLQSGSANRHEVLALGPLTNIAQFIQAYPDQKHAFTRIVWMGGSAGPGNHTARAEFNAFADAEAFALIVASNIPIDVVDLTFCRKHTFGEGDLPEADALTRDLLGGYLDIALNRGRSAMAIYDPLAAMAIARPDCIEFTPCSVEVSTEPGESYGATGFSPAKLSTVRLSTRANCDLTKSCLEALEGELVHGSG